MPCVPSSPHVGALRTRGLALARRPPPGLRPGLLSGGSRARLRPGVTRHRASAGAASVEESSRSTRFFVEQSECESLGVEPVPIHGVRPEDFAAWLETQVCEACEACAQASVRVCECARVLLAPATRRRAPLSVSLSAPLFLPRFLSLLRTRVRFSVCLGAWMQECEHMRWRVCVRAREPAR